MRLVILIFVLLGYGTSIYSQEESQNFLFSGMLIIENGTSIEYIIDVKIDENGNLIGSSKSKLEGAFESTSVLSGYYYWKNKTISFSEVMDSTEVPDSLKLLLQNDTEMCFVKVVDLPIKNLLGKFSFSGDFKGEFASGEKCAQGKISMWGNEFIDFVPKIRIKDDVFQFPENNGSMELINIDDDKLKEVVTAKKNSHLQVVNSSDSVCFEFWDGGEVDGDSIQIFLNKKLFVNNIELYAESTQIKLPMHNKTCKFRIVAMSQGRKGLNTVNYKICMLNKVIEFRSVLKKGEYFDLEFVSGK